MRQFTTIQVLGFGTLAFFMGFAPHVASAYFKAEPVPASIYSSEETTITLNRMDERFGLKLYDGPVIPDYERGHAFRFDDGLVIVQGGGNGAYARCDRGELQINNDTSNPTALCVYRR